MPKDLTKFCTKYYLLSSETFQTAENAQTLKKKKKVVDVLKCPCSTNRSESLNKVFVQLLNGDPWRSNDRWFVATSLSF